MITPDLAERNIQSWQKVIRDYERFVSSASWAWLEPMLHLVRKIAGTEQAWMFRAGRSIYYLMISTAAQHGLKEDEPFVRVMMEAQPPVQILYWDVGKNGFDWHTLEPGEELYAALMPFLDRLWNETRGKKTGAENEGNAAGS